MSTRSYPKPTDALQKANDAANARLSAYKVAAERALQRSKAGNRPQPGATELSGVVASVPQTR